MKSFIQFLLEDLSPEYQELLEPYNKFPPTNPLDNEKEIYDDIKFTDFQHYMKTQIAVVTKYITQQGIGNDPNKIKTALEETFMKPEIQQAFRLHYAKHFPEKVNNK